MIPCPPSRTIVLNLLPAESLDDECDLDAQIADKVVGDAFIRVPSNRVIRTVRPLPSLLEHEVMVRGLRRG